MTVDEIDSLMALLDTLRQQGFFVGSWVSPEQAEALVHADRVSVQSMWSYFARVFQERVTVRGTVAHLWPAI